MDQENWRLAGFNERMLAFTIDYALFGTLYAASPRGPMWLAIAGGGFLAYSALMSCGGRATLGKWVLGLRVVNADWEPLDAPSAAIRSVTYLVSSVMSLGFITSLFNKGGQAWHDKVAGSYVVAQRVRGGLENALVQLGGVACLSFFLGAWSWQNIYVARLDRQKAVAHGEQGLSEIGMLQRRYHARYGRYATDLESLAKVSVDPEGFVRDMNALYGSQRNIRFKPESKGFRVEARVNDGRGTMVARQES
jgi:uncharacterized RDD family membrane protein YckC